MVTNQGSTPRGYIEEIKPDVGKYQTWGAYSSTETAAWTILMLTGNYGDVLKYMIHCVINCCVGINRILNISHGGQDVPPRPHARVDLLHIRVCKFDYCNSCDDQQRYIMCTVSLINDRVFLISPYRVLLYFRRSAYSNIGRSVLNNQKKFFHV